MEGKGREGGYGEGGRVGGRRERGSEGRVIEERSKN